MSTSPGMLVTLPRDEEESIFWWDMAGDGIVARGEDIDPLAAAGHEDAFEDGWIVALAPAARCNVRNFAFEGLTPAQAEAAARLEAAERSVGGLDRLHIAARQLGTEAGDVLTAAIASAELAQGLAILQQRGLDPDVVMPASLVPPVPEDGAVQAVIGSEPVLRGADVACIDEPGLREALIGDAPVTAYDGEALDEALWAAYAAPLIDLRTGIFRKRRSRVAITPQQWRVLAALLGFVLLGSLLIGLALLIKYESDAAREDRLALAEARKVIPGATDLAAAEQELRARLSRQGHGALIFTAPSAALYAALRPVPGATLRQLAYEPGGLLSASISSARPEDINAVLMALQNDGYVVTANSRQEANGESWADITVRAP